MIIVIITTITIIIIIIIIITTITIINFNITIVIIIIIIITIIKNFTIIIITFSFIFNFFGNRSSRVTFVFEFIYVLFNYLFLLFIAFRCNILLTNIFIDFLLLALFFLENLSTFNKKILDLSYAITLTVDWC